MPSIWQETSVSRKFKSGGRAFARIRILDGYESWSLFLICDPAWLTGDQVSRSKLKRLHSQFRGFGSAIGPSNVAVWFGGEEPVNPGFRALKPNYLRVIEYDADRAAKFCARYGLVAKGSPYVVVTTQYPAEVEVGGYVRPRKTPANYYKLSLSKLDMPQIERLLGSLADQVRSSDLSQVKIDSERYWTLWEQVLHRSLKAIGRMAKAVKVTINTAVVKVEINGDKVISPSARVR